MILTIAGVALAIVLAVQAASNALTRTNPVVAASVFPWNGSALAGAVFQSFAGGVKKQEDIVPAAQSLRAEARHAIMLEPLSPRALAVLALAAGDTTEGRRILSAATDSNRRDTRLQGIQLQWAIANADYRATVAALNRLLRVDSALSHTLYPQLERVLAEPRAIAPLSETLDDSAEWHRSFLRAATDRKELLPNIALLRDRLAFRDAELDQKLIERLTATGRTERAQQIYRSIPADNAGERGATAWPVRYPPFDWQLVSEAGLRAEPSIDGKQLEVFVRSGQGGIIARRVIGANAGSFAVEVEHDLSPSDQIRDVHLQAYCTGEEEPFFDRPFGAAKQRYQVSGIPAGCGIVEIAVSARAWTGRSSIRGTIGRIAVVG